MQITLQQLNESYPALARLAQAEFPKQHHKTAYRISRFVKFAKAELELATESLNDLMRRCGFEPGDQGVSEEQKADYQAQFNRFMKETSCDLPGDSIGLSELPDNLSISASDLALLDWLIVDGFPSVD